MKIIFVLPDLGAGGAERVVSILSKSLVERGMAVDIVMLLSDRISYQIQDSVNVIAFNAAQMSKIERIAVLRKYFKEEKKKHNKITVLPFHDSCLKYCLAASAGNGVQVIACERNDPYQKGRDRLARFKANLPYAMADRCVFQTRDAAAYYKLVKSDKKYIIVNPLKLSGELQWQGEDSKRIISVGRLEPQKNQKMLINAFAKLHHDSPDYILEIYGEGSLRGQLQKQISELELEASVFLRGYASDIHEKLTQAEMFVLSSDYEGMSNALIEALAVGTPVVTTDHPIGGAKMLIKDGVSGIFTAVGDTDAFHKAMEHVLKDDELKRTLSRNSRKVRDMLSVDKVTDQWMDVITF